MNPLMTEENWFQRNGVAWQFQNIESGPRWQFQNIENSEHQIDNHLAAHNIEQKRMVTNSSSKYDLFLSAKLTALGVRLNDEAEWTMADKLLAPMQLLALYQKRDSTPSMQEIADVFIPVDKEELHTYIPCHENGWQLPCIDFRTDMSYRFDLEIFRKLYLRQYEVCNHDPDTQQMASWETILKYWRQAARFFLSYWAMHADLDKLDATNAASDIVRKAFFQHYDLDKYCDNKLLPDFKKKMIAKSCSRKRRATSISSSHSSYCESESGDELSEAKPTSDSSNCESGDELSEAKPTSDSSNCESESSDELSDQKKSSIGLLSDGDNDSSFQLAEDNSTSIASEESELKNGNIYDLDDNNAIVMDYAPEGTYQTVPFSTFINAVVQNESESLHDGNGGNEGDESLGSQDAFQQLSYDYYAAGQDFCLEMFTPGKEATDPVEPLDSCITKANLDLDDPGLAYKLEKSDLYSNIRHFVDHLVLYGLMPPGMTSPTWSSVQNTMKVFGMHIEEQSGASNEGYVKAYSSWVPEFHVDNFPRYMSSFHEICCCDAMMARGLQSKNSHELQEIPWSKIDKRIQVYLKCYAPPTVKKHNWEEIMRLLRGVDK
jgi:hypothetical protein